VPDSVSISQVLDSLSYLFDSLHLSANTVRGYRFSFASSLPCLLNAEVEDTMVLNLLIRGLGNIRPPGVKPLPSWNLALVLQVLGQVIISNLSLRLA
jgi:hypothetical protein